MATPRYRWHAIETVRSVRRTQAQNALARAQAVQHAAAQAVERARQALEAHLARTPRAPSDCPSDSALELQRLAAYAHEHMRCARVLREALDAAKAELVSCGAQVEHAQHALAHDSAEVRVVERDRKRVERLLANLRQARAQAELDERVRKQAGSSRAPTDGS